MSDDTSDEQKMAIARAKRAAYMREHRQNNKEKYKEIDREKAKRAREKDPEKFTKQANERSKRHYHRRRANETPEQKEKRRVAHLARCKKWRDKDVEHANSTARVARKKLYAENPQKFIDRGKRRHYHLANGSVTKEEWAAICETFHHRCGYCRKQPDELCQDHVIPLSKGGPHAPDNVVPSCRSCNSTKGNRDWPRPVPMTADELAAVLAAEASVAETI